MTPENNTPSVQRHGLCVTCIHADDCVYMRRSESPVQQCNEFAVFYDVADQKSAASTIAETDDVKPQEELYRGLCMNCDERNNCGPTKTRAGVWQCEEYK